MIKIDSVQKCNCPKIRPTFTSTPNKSIQTDNLSNVTPDYNVKVPTAFQKSGEIDLPFGFKAHMYKLANGQRVVIIPKEGETVLKTYVNTGSMNEPDNLRGISHYIEHNLFNGSNGLEAGEFFNTVNKMGANTNASTGFAETNYFISSNLLNKDDLEKKIKIHASMLESPRFALEMLEKEKGIVNSEINMITSDPDNIATNTVIRNLFNIKSTSPDLIGGSTNNITNLTRDDVIDYFNNNYFPANMITVVSGEVDPQKTIQLISKYFSAPNKISKSRKFEELIPVEKTVRQDITSDKATAVSLALGFKGPNNNDAKGQVGIDALSELLVSPKMGRLKKGLRNYNTKADIMVEKISSKPNAPSAIILFGETNEQNSQKVLQEIYNQIHSIIINPPTDDEMQMLKKSLINRYSKTFEFSHSTNNLVGTNMLNGSLAYVTDYEKIVNSLTKDDITDFAKMYLDLNKVSIAAVHPKKSVSFTGLKEIKRYRAANNFEIVTNPAKTSNSTVMINFQTPEDFNAKPATVCILNEILKEGSALRDFEKFNNDMSKNGIDAEFTSTTNEISAIINCQADDLKEAMKAAKEVLTNPRFTQSTLDFVKNEIKSSLEIKEKDADDKLYKELLDGTELSFSKEDILKDIDTVTLDEVKALYNHIISTSQGTASICAMSNEQFFDEISKFPAVKPFKPFLKDTFKPVEETKVLTDIHDKNQAQIIEAFKFKTNHNIKEDTSIELLNIILGGNASSRLFNDLREKQQLAYRVNSKVIYADNSGLMKLQIGTTTENKETGEISYDNLKKSVDGFNFHINRLKTEKVTQEELDCAKLYLKNQILSAAQGSEGKAFSAMSGLLSFYGPGKDDEILKAIDTITIDDIYNMANYIFAQKPTYSVLATENTLKANKDYLSNISNLYKT